LVAMCSLPTRKRIHAWRAHPARVTQIEFSPSGYLVATAGNLTAADEKEIIPCSVSLWDARTAKQIRSIQSTSADVTALKFAQDGKSVFVAELHKQVRKHLLSGTTRMEFGLNSGSPSAFRQVAISRDGRFIAAANTDQTVQVWDAKTRQMLHSFRAHTDATQSVAFFPDGRRIVTAGGGLDRTIKIWDWTSGTVLATYSGLRHVLESVEVSPDGRFVISAGGTYTYPESEVVLWDVSKGARVWTSGHHKKTVTCARFSPDGNVIATSSDDGTVMLHDPIDGHVVTTLRGHTDVVRSVAFSRDGSLIASTSHDETARIWNVSTGKQLLKLEGHSSRVTSSAFSDDGRLLATGGDDATARVWDVATGRERSVCRGHLAYVLTVNFVPKSTTLVTGSFDDAIGMWRAETGKNLTMLTPTNRYIPGTYYATAASADGRYVVGGAGAALVWDTATGAQVSTFQGHRSTVLGLKFLPDQKRIVSCGADKMARLWEVASGKELRVFAGHRGAVRDVSLSADGTRLATAAYDKTGRVWDLKSGKTISELRGHRDDLVSICLSPDGRQVVTAAKDGQVILWDANTGRQIRLLGAHAGWARSVAFSPDGRLVASAGDDRKIHVVDLSGKRVYPVLLGYAPENVPPSALGAAAEEPRDTSKEVVRTLAFTPDGRRLAAGSENGYVLVLDVETGRRLLTLGAHSGNVTSVAFSSDNRILTVAHGNANERSPTTGRTGVTVWYADRSREDTKRAKGTPPGLGLRVFDQYQKTNALL
jgi:WD40 repeat protein